MLWRKGWLETKVRLLLLLGCMAFYLIVFYSMRTIASPPGRKPAATFGLTAMIFTVVLYAWLAGAGIVTQPFFQAAKGLYGSTLFTLSLPVSRFRLLAIRAGAGWLEMTGAIGAWCWGSWLVLPVVRGSVTAVEMFEYMLVLVVCASSLYSLSVLLATFLDDQWRIWSTIGGSGALWGLSYNHSMPVTVNIFRAMGEGSPLVAHSMPWATMAFSFGLTATLFFVALKVVQNRQY